jgi:hypothetical protein
LHDEHLAQPSEQRREDGLQARNLANASLAVGILGAAAVGLDLLVLSNESEDSASLSTCVVRTWSRGCRF